MKLSTTVMKLSTTVRKKMLKMARDLNERGQLPCVSSLCQEFVYPVNTSIRKTVADLLDAEGVPRRRSPRRTVKESLSVGAGEFGQKFESLSQVFVHANKNPIRDKIIVQEYDFATIANRNLQSPCDDIDIYLVARAKAGSVRAFEILKKVVG